MEKHHFAWLKQAVSKDITRDNLCRIWHEPGRSFATDGHRLHVVPSNQTQGVTSEPPAEYHMVPPRIDHVVSKGHPAFELDGRVFVAAIKQSVEKYETEGWRIPTVMVSYYERRLVVKAVKAGPLRSYYLKNPPKRKRDEANYEPGIPGEEILSVPFSDMEPHNFDSKRIMGFNAKYLLAALGTRIGVIKWSQASPNDACKIEHSDGRIAIVMPRGI